MGVHNSTQPMRHNYAGFIATNLSFTSISFMVLATHHKKDLLEGGLNIPLRCRVQGRGGLVQEQ